MRVLVSGATGLVGAAVTEALRQAGHQAVSLGRRPRPGDNEAIAWDPEAGRLEKRRLEGLDAVVHLAGESVANGRWTATKKARILNSRVQGARLLAETLAGLARRPAVLASASAIGFYGDRGDEELDESSPPGSGFLADVCRQWEAATQPAAEAGVRVACLRLGVVLSPRGGALAKMLPLFRWGLGGRLGSGRQYVSWITLDDAAAAILRILDDAGLRGPVNLTAPGPVTNAELTRTLAQVLGRPAIFPAPAWALRLGLGEMAREMLLSSARVLPRRLEASGFAFQDPDLAAALSRRLQVAAGR